MASKLFFALCATALFFNKTSASCIGVPSIEAPIAPAVISSTAVPIPNPALLPGLPLNSVPISANSGGSFTVSSASPIAPSGVSVISENALEGPVAVGGQVPLLSAVALEGQVPSSGSAASSYSCGNENVGIVSETFSPGYSLPSAVASGLSPLAGGLSPLNGRVPLANGVSPFGNRLSPIANRLSPFSNGLSPFSNGLSPVANGLSPLPNGLSPLSGGLSPLANARGLGPRALNPAKGCSGY